MKFLYLKTVSGRDALVNLNMVTSIERATSNSCYVNTTNQHLEVAYKWEDLFNAVKNIAGIEYVAEMETTDNTAY